MQDDVIDEVDEIDRIYDIMKKGRQFDEFIELCVPEIYLKELESRKNQDQNLS